MRQNPYNEFKALHAIKVTPSKIHEKCHYCHKIIFAHIVDFYEQKIKFCPKCGQKLSEEEKIVETNILKVEKVSRKSSKSG
jgi:ribosomal protein L37AE/L43A